MKIKIKKKKEGSSDSKKPKLISVFRLFEQSVKFYWKHIKPLIKMSLFSLLGILPIAVLAVIAFIVTLLITNFGLPSNLFIKIILGIVSIAVVLMALLCSLWFSIRSKIGLYLLVKNHFTSVKENWKDSQKLFWPFFMVGLITIVFVLLWMLLFIIPGIIFAVLYSFSAFVFIFEGIKGRAALRRSKELVKGYFWPVFGRYLFFGLAIWIFSFLIALPGGSDPESARYIFWQTISSIIGFLISPVSLVYSYLLYCDLKEKKSS